MRRRGQMRLTAELWEADTVHGYLQVREGSPRLFLERNKSTAVFREKRIQSKKNPRPFLGNKAMAILREKKIHG